MHSILLFYIQRENRVETESSNLEAAQQAESSANDSGTQRKFTKSGLQPSIDLTFHSELYLNLASLGIWNMAK